MSPLFFFVFLLLQAFSLGGDIHFTTYDELKLNNQPKLTLFTETENDTIIEKLHEVALDYAETAELPIFVLPHERDIFGAVFDLYDHLPVLFVQLPGEKAPTFYHGMLTKNGIHDYFDAITAQPDYDLISRPSGRDEYDQLMKENTVSFIAFTASWCVHSAKMLDHFARAAALVDETPVGFVHVVCDTPENIEVCARHNIHGYPTLMFHMNRRYEVYTGARETVPFRDAAREAFFSMSTTTIDLDNDDANSK